VGWHRVQATRGKAPSCQPNPPQQYHLCCLLPVCRNLASLQSVDLEAEQADQQQEDRRRQEEEMRQVRRTFFFKLQGGHPPPSPAGHTQLSRVNPTAGARRQSLTNEGGLTHPISGGAQCLDQKWWSTFCQGKESCVKGGCRFRAPSSGRAHGCAKSCVIMSARQRVQHVLVHVHAV
jgi:hypothetical protein